MHHTKDMNTQPGIDQLSASFDSAKDENWRRYAACQNENPEMFFPEGKSRSARLQAVAAKKICQSCVVTQQCLEQALIANEYFGIWGGMDENERSRMWRRRNVADRMVY